MIQKPLTFVGTSDVSGRLRGKSFPTDQLNRRIKTGVGWTPTNVMITCFDSIANGPYGSFGDLVLVPDDTTRVQLDYQDNSATEDFMIGNICHLNGTPWACCTRSILQQALDTLYTQHGIIIKGAFEHEFQLKNPDTNIAGGFTYRDFRRHNTFGKALVQALENAGIRCDSFMKEYGPQQFEIPVAPSTGVNIADTATILREITYGTAERFDNTATFTPIWDPENVGNGVHIHMSFLDTDNTPITYEANDPHGMSPVTAQFIAGVLKYLPAIVAFTAPSRISYERLTPHRWSAAYNNLGYQDREAAVRICPVNSMSVEKTAAQYNFEYRAADSSASPYLALSAVVIAGTLGITQKLARPNPTEIDLSEISSEKLAQMGYQRLPKTLTEALQIMNNTPEIVNAFGQQFCQVYTHHKRGELAFLESKNPEQIYDIYAQVY